MDIFEEVGFGGGGERGVVDVERGRVGGGVEEGEEVFEGFGGEVEFEAQAGADEEVFDFGEDEGERDGEVGTGVRDFGEDREVVGGGRGRRDERGVGFDDFYLCLLFAFCLFVFS